MTREVGVTVLPELFQVEGVARVLDNLQSRAGVTAIATSPYVMRPVADGDGGREPPIDAGAGSVRILDRPLWGRRDLWVRTAPSFAPECALYEGLRYQPPTPDELTAREGGRVAEAISAARQRGLKVHLQIQAAIPPGYRVQFGGPLDEDRPRLPDGSSPAVRVDNNGSLASPHILAYAKALIRDVVRAYPFIDVLRLDWPEYPPYSLDSLFFDFSIHARAAISAMGHDPHRLAQAAARLRARVASELSADDIERLADGVSPAELFESILCDGAVADWLSTKARIVTNFIAGCAETLRAASGGRIVLMPQVFPPPWTLFSGFDMAGVAKLGVAAIGVKLYTMHWPMMLRAYADAIACANPPAAHHPRLGEALMRITAVDSDASRYGALGSIHYPEPEEAHPAGTAEQTAKITSAMRAAAPISVWAFVHGYGPAADFERRAKIAFDAAEGRLFVNRYGYLSDAKLDALGRVTRAR